MATITEVELQDGSVHQLGGSSGGNTYTLTKSGDTITLTGSGGDTSSVTDSDTTYTVAVNGNTLTFTPSTGQAQSVTLPDKDTTYTISLNGRNLILTPSSGVAQSLTLPFLRYTKDANDVGSNTNNVVQNDVDNNIADGGYALAEGKNTGARGKYSHAEGLSTSATGMSSHAEGANTYATAFETHAEGNGSSATGWYAHAEGTDTLASGLASHAEGYGSRAISHSSHAEGEDTRSTGNASHSEGMDSIASGTYSHAQNNGTIAQRRSQTAIGEYNLQDTTGSGETVRGDYAFIIGNGTADDARSNAFMVDWDGDIYPQATKMADFVVDQGSGYNGYYRKWNSGKAEWWRYESGNNGLSTSAWSSSSPYTAFGYADYSRSTVWSGLFNATPTIVNVTSNHYWSISIIPFSITQNGCSLRFITVGSSSNLPWALSYYVIGTWK